MRICSVKDKPILPLLQKENVARSEDARKPSGPQAARVSQMIPVPKKIVRFTLRREPCKMQVSAQ